MKILNKINKERGLKLIYDLNPLRFLNLNIFNAFKYKNSPQFILYKYRNPIKNLPIDIDEHKSVNIGFGYLHYVSNSEIIFGYLLELPKLDTRIYPNMVTLNNGEPSNFDIILKDKNMSIFTDSVSSLLVVAENPAEIRIK